VASAVVERVRRAVDPRRNSKLGMLSRAVQRYVDDGMVERAPAIAYYGILSLFPSLLLAITLVRLVGGDSAPDDLARYAQEHGASGAVASALRSAGTSARETSVPTAGAAGLIGVLTLVYGASKAFTATGRAIDATGGGARTARSIRRRAEDLGWTILLLLLALVALVLLAISGDVLEDLLGLLGLSGPAVTIWSFARLPVAAALGLFIVALVYWAAPSQDKTRFRAVTPGAFAAMAVLLLATIGFNVYVTRFASYNSTYGASAGLIILLLWIWLGASAVLYGAEVDEVLEERAGREPRRAGTPATGRRAPLAADTPAGRVGRALDSRRRPTVPAPILVAFSPDSADHGPVNFAAAAARFTGAPLVLVAVGDSAAAGLDSELRARGVSATVRAVQHEKPAHAITDAVEELAPALVVVGSTRRGTLGRVLLGSTAEHVMKGSPCPVVVVPRGHEEPTGGLRAVGAAFLPTAGGRETLRSAALLARSGGARLVAVMVLSPKHAGEQSPGLMAAAHHDHDVSEDIASRERITAEDALREALAASAADLDAESDILFQEPADGLVAASARLDLLVMGSAHHGPAGGVALGGVARRVTAHAACPVLVLPHEAAGRLDALLSGTGAPAAG
jgi:membrane protein